MRIAVFGSTGITGQLLVKQALEAGYEVVAFARNPAKLAIKSERLTIVQGSLTDIEPIEQTVCGAEAVISLLGPTGNVKGTPLSTGTKQILSAMKKHGVRRIVAVSTASAGDPNDRFDFKFKLLVSLIKLGMRGAYKEIVTMADAIRTSELDWTLVRVPFLTNKQGTGKVRVGYYGHGIIRARLSRADLARFMLEQLQDPTYIQKAPAISN